MKTEQAEKHRRPRTMKARRDLAAAVEKSQRIDRNTRRGIGDWRMDGTLPGEVLLDGLVAGA